MTPADPLLHTRDQRERAQERGDVPNWWEFPGTLEDWCNYMNTVHPLPEVEAKHAAFVQRHEASLARIAAIDEHIAEIEQRMADREARKLSEPISGEEADV